MNIGSALGPVAKAERQQAILDLIRDRKVRTQEEIVAALRHRSLDVTQATVSRDIRELGLAGSTIPTARATSPAATPTSRHR